VPWFSIAAARWVSGMISWLINENHGACREGQSPRQERLRKRSPR
jgi:hypothetical protein